MSSMSGLWRSMARSRSPFIEMVRASVMVVDRSEVPGQIHADPGDVTARWLHRLEPFYRFGPPSHDVVVATLLRDGDSFPGRSTRCGAHALGCMTTHRSDCQRQLRRWRLPSWLTSTQRFAYCVSFDAAGFDPDEQLLLVGPGGRSCLDRRPTPRSRGLQGSRQRAKFGEIGDVSAGEVNRDRVGLSITVSPTLTESQGVQCHAVAQNASGIHFVLA